MQLSGMPGGKRKPTAHLIMDGYHYVKCAHELARKMCVGEGQGLDIRRVLQHLEERFGLDSKVFVDSTPQRLDQARRDFNTMLSGLGFEVPADFRYKLRTQRDVKSGKQFTAWTQSGVDVGLACLVLRRCVGLQAEPRVPRGGPEAVVLCLGDGDFECLIRLLKEAGKRVVIMGFSGSMAGCVRELADQVLFLDEMWEQLRHRRGKPNQGCRYVGCPCPPLQGLPLCHYHTCPLCQGIKRSSAEACAACSERDQGVVECSCDACHEPRIGAGGFCQHHTCPSCGGVKGFVWPQCRTCADQQQYGA